MAQELVAPIVLGEADVISGYHHIVTPAPGSRALGRAVTLLFLYLTKGFRRLNQPWGGATAIRRTRFEDLAVAKLWAEKRGGTTSPWRPGWCKPASGC